MLLALAHAALRGVALLLEGEGAWPFEGTTEADDCGM